jgi:hypothetical protein
MLKPKSDPKIIHFQFNGLPTVHSSPEWCLESNILALKHKLGLGIWHAHKIIKDYAPVNDSSPTATDSSSVSNPSEPAMVSKPTSKGKNRKKTTQLQSLTNVLAESNNSDSNEGYLRDRTDRPTHPLSNGVDE